MNGEAIAVDQEKKEKILQTAKELFSRYGFKKATVDEIAESAGISKRTLYETFDNKEAILAELVMAEALSFRKVCLAQLKTLDTPTEKLRLLCQLTTKYFDENPFLGAVLDDDAGLYTPFLDNEIHRVEDGIQGIIANILADGVQQGSFREMNISATARCILILFRGFTYRRDSIDDGKSEWIGFIVHSIEKK